MPQNTEARLTQLATEHHAETVKRDNAIAYRDHLTGELTKCMVALGLERFGTPSGLTLVLIYRPKTPKGQDPVPWYVTVK